ncbi:MAG: MBL fold metallo-hydrolase [Xanthomonadales bacterium]|nr:MBL fold metallo-hydrolase [Xanthomonadales bacterium]
MQRWMRQRWVVGFAFALVSVLAGAQSFEAIAPDLHLLRGAFVPGQQPDGNSVMLRGRDGWIVVDTGRHDAHTQAILDHAARSGVPISDIINSHWHLDHVSGNVMVRTAYPRAEVHASGAIVAAQRGFLADYRKQLVALAAGQPDAPELRSWVAEIARIDLGERLHPTVPIIENGRRVLAGRDLDIHLTTQAVTDGDVWAYDRMSRTLIAGDLVTLPVPFLDTACPAGWREVLEDLRDQLFTRLVPGHGPVMDRKDFRRYRIGFAHLLDCAARTSRTATQCADRWIADLGELLPTAEHARTRELLDYYLPQRLRGAAASADCPRR